MSRYSNYVVLISNCTLSSLKTVLLLEYILSDVSVLLIRYFPPFVVVTCLF